MESFLPQGGIWAMILGATPVVKLVMGILIVMSLACWSIIFVKLFSLGSARRDTTRDLDRFHEAETLKLAMRTMAQDKGSPAYEVCLRGYEELVRLEEADLSSEEKTAIAEENVRRALRRGVGTEVGRLSRKLAFLASCANAAPFIGLFGTVWGIMNSFHGIAMQRTASLATVAPGISEALIATAIGLAVAIPATLAYNYFLGSMQQIERQLDIFADTFLNRAQREVSWIMVSEPVEEPKRKRTLRGGF
ncbi:protein TolQ [Desulfovibrio inopinatus]|uniref:protein TolQ n=1 Tax=Desulfovibrio inopinatus TaxID=102109 RepID=UPI00041B06AE|nr:protein TolQ [Desulfovibrio inopinatus]